MKRNDKIVILAVLALLAFPCISVGYEISTHAGMSNIAFGKSTLSLDATIARLGLSDIKLRVGRLGSTYRDLADTNIINSRDGLEFEFNKFPVDLITNAESFSARAWLMRGAVREDDTSTFVSYLPGAGNFPTDDPYGPFNRFCNHFFDPVNVRALTGFCFNSTLDMSPNWAIGTADAFASTVQRQSFYRNHFSVFAAREAMWRALTLRDKNGLNIALGTTTPALASERLAYWATTFRSVGDVVHLLQDMAQPQHTRNEGHPSGAAAWYEAYADARAGGPSNNPARTFEIDAGTLSVAAGTLRPLDYELRDSTGNLVAYPIPLFNSYTDYWTTARGAVPRDDASIANGLGLADYSNRGFLTVGTSLNGATSSEYRFPPRLSSDPTYTQSDVVNLCDSSSANPIKAKYLLRNVVDVAMPSTTEKIKLQSRSVWNTTGVSFFTMNHCVMDDNLRLLIPRAVAYSAGLIDYFFRGKLDFKVSDENFYAIADHSDVLVNNKMTGGFSKIKVNVKNVTDPITPPGSAVAINQDMTSGNLVAIVKFRRNNCYRADTMQGQPGGPAYTSACRSVDEEIVVSDILPVPAPINADFVAVSFDFSGNRIPINAVDVSLQIAFRGTLGTEPDAVAVETKNISEPNFFSLANYTDCHIRTDGTAELVTGAPQSFQFRFHDPATDTVPATDIATANNVPAGRFARVAFLTDNFSYKKYMRADYSYSFPVAMNDNFYPVDTINNPRPFGRTRPLLGGAGDLYEHDGFGFYPGLATDTGSTGSQRCTGSVFPSFTTVPYPLTTLNF